MNPFEIETTPDSIRLRLSGEITIEHARALHAALLAQLTPTHSLALDAVELTRLDAAALQVLLAAARAAAGASLAAPAPALDTACARFALAHPFLLPLAL